MVDDNYVKIFSGTFIIVQLVLDRLESVGIDAIVIEESGGSASHGYQELYVAKEELDHAIPIVESVKAELEL